MKNPLDAVGSDDNPALKTRRDLLKAGAVLAAATPGMTGVPAPAIAQTAVNLPRAPNIIVLMTDQERHHMHWPKGWAEANLPGLQRLKRHGLYFQRAYTAVTQCSPARALIQTGRFAPVNRVTQTLNWPGLVHQDRQPNIASLLKEKAGYEVVWKGKWHLAWAADAAPGNGGVDFTPADIEVMEKNWGWSRWNPPDAGNSLLEWMPSEFGLYDGLATLGGGDPNNDGRYIEGVSPGALGQTQGFGESVVEFLRNRAPKLGRPFCLFVSLVNPHDVWAYPHAWRRAGYKYEDFASLDIELPPNYDDDLSTKPAIQKRARDNYNLIAPLDTDVARREYVRFYAHLNKLADGHVVTVLNTLEETGLMDNTIVIRIADHGEGGLSHGMREKAYTVYEEMIHIPLIIHNPKLFPEPSETDAFYDHLDLLPTLLDLAGVERPESYALGKSIVPVIRDPSRSVHSFTTFSYDDLMLLPPSEPGSHIRAVREGDWTYAVYFGFDGAGLDYELYNIKSDPLQLNNLLYQRPTPADIRKEWLRLHRLVTARCIEVANLPDSFTWPIDPLGA